MTIYLFNFINSTFSHYMSIKTSQTTILFEKNQNTMIKSQKICFSKTFAMEIRTGREMRRRSFWFLDSTNLFTCTKTNFDTLYQILISDFPLSLTSRKSSQLQVLIIFVSRALNFSISQNNLTLKRTASIICLIQL